MAIDPRRLAGLQIQLDALAQEAAWANSPALDAALETARRALEESHEILVDRGLYMQVPDDYKPPKGVGGCRGGDRD